MDIREIRLGDAKRYLELRNKLDEQTQYIPFGFGGRPSSIEEQRERLKQIRAEKRTTLMVADNGNDLIGFVAVCGNDIKSTRHRASVFIGIVEEFQNQGIGKQLMTSAESWAKEQGIQRLELTVISQNKQALWLYGRLNYTVEGIRRNAIVFNEEFVNEFYMSKMIQ